MLNGSSLKMRDKSAFDAVKAIYDWLEEDNSRARKGNDRLIDFQAAINRFNDDAHNFSEMDEVPLDSDSNQPNSIAQSLALFSHESGGQGGGAGRGSGRSNQGRYNSRGAKSGEQGKGKPKRPDRASRQETQQFKEMHNKDPAARAYAPREKPGTFETISVPELIKNAMYLYAVLLKISASTDVHETCRLDSETLGRMFEWISLSVDAQQLSKLTADLKNKAREKASAQATSNVTKESVKKLRKAAASKITPAVSTGPNHAATMIRLKQNEYFPGDLYSVMLKRWDGLGRSLSHSVQLQPLKKVVNFLRSDPYLLASARISEHNLIGPQTSFETDCRKLPGVDEVVRLMHAACSARVVRQALSATTRPTKPLPSIQQQYDRSPNNRQRLQQRGRHIGRSGGKGQAQQLQQLEWDDHESYHGSDEYDHHEDYQDDDEDDYQDDVHRGSGPAEQALHDAWQRGVDRARSHADHARNNRQQKGALVTMPIEEFNELQSQASRPSKQTSTNGPTTAQHGSQPPVNAGKPLDIKGNARLETLFHGAGH